MSVLRAIVAAILLLAFAWHIFVAAGTIAKENGHKQALTSCLMAIIELAAAFAVIYIRL